MSVTYVPQDRSGEEAVSRAAQLFMRWDAEHKQQMLAEQMSQSELQTATLHRQLMQQSLDQNNATGPLTLKLLGDQVAEQDQRTKEFNDPSAIAQRQAQGEAVTSEATSRASLMKNQADRIPFVNATDDQLKQVAIARAKSELEGMDLDNGVKKLRLPMESELMMNMLAKSKQEVQQSMAITEQTKAQTAALQQSSQLDIAAHTIQLLRGASDGSVPPAAVANLQQNPLFAPYLKGVDPNYKGPPKTEDEVMADQLQKTVAAAQAPDATPQQKSAAAAMMSLASKNYAAASIENRPINPAHPEWGTAPVKSSEKMQKTMIDALTAQANYQKMKTAATQPAATQPTQPIAQPVAGAASASVMDAGATVPPPVVNAMQSISKIQEYVASDPDMAKVAFSSNFKKNNKFTEFVNKTPFEGDAWPDLSSEGDYHIGRVGNINDATWRNQLHYSTNTPPPPDILTKKLDNGIDNADSEAFQANVADDKAASAGKHLLYVGLVSQLAKLRASGQDKAAPELLKSFYNSYGPAALTKTQNDSIGRLITHFGW